MKPPSVLECAPATAADAKLVMFTLGTLAYGSAVVALDHPLAIEPCPPGGDLPSQVCGMIPIGGEESVPVVDWRPAEAPPGPYRMILVVGRGPGARQVGMAILLADSAPVRFPAGRN